MCQAYTIIFVVYYFDLLQVAQFFWSEKTNKIAVWDITRRRDTFQVALPAMRFSQKEQEFLSLFIPRVSCDIRRWCLRHVLWWLQRQLESAHSLLWLPCSVEIPSETKSGSERRSFLLKNRNWMHMSIGGYFPTYNANQFMDKNNALSSPVAPRIISSTSKAFKCQARITSLEIVIRTSINVKSK